MLDFLGSAPPCHDKRAAYIVSRPSLALGRRQRRVERVQLRIYHPPRRGCQACIAADGQNRSNPFDGIAKTGLIFANYLSRILKLEPANRSRLERFPVFFEEEGERLQYAWDGDTLRIVPVDQKREASVHAPQTQGQVPKVVQDTADRIGRALRRTFVPENVRTHYLVYMKWKFLHRMASSIIQVQGTQVTLCTPSDAALDCLSLLGVGWKNCRQGVSSYV